MKNYIKNKLKELKNNLKKNNNNIYINKLEEEKIKERFIESPFMSDFSTYFFNCRRNLISFSLFILFYYIYGEKIFGNSDLKVFNVSVSKNNIEEIKPAILIILCYFLLHFTYLSVNYIRENIIRITGEKPEYSKLLKSKLLKNGNSSEFDKMEPEKQLNVGVFVSALVENDNLFLNETERKVLPKKHILNALSRFEKYAKVFKAEQIVTKLIFDIMMPITVGVVALSILNYTEVFYAMGVICGVSIWYALSTNAKYSLLILLMMISWVALFIAISIQIDNYKNEINTRITDEVLKYERENKC